MLATPHIVVGALIGAKTHNLGLIVILGLLSHIIMDKIPHWDYSFSSDIERFKKEKSIKYLFPVTIKFFTDVVIGLLIVAIFIWQKNILNTENLIFILLGILFACFLDVIMLIAVFWNSNKTWQKIFIIMEKFLHFQHKEKEGQITFLGLATQILVIAIAIILFFS